MVIKPCPKYSVFRNDLHRELVSCIYRFWLSLEFCFVFMYFDGFWISRRDKNMQKGRTEFIDLVKLFTLLRRWTLGLAKTVHVYLVRNCSWLVRRKEQTYFDQRLCHFQEMLSTLRFRALLMPVYNSLIRDAVFVIQDLNTEHHQIILHPKYNKNLP